MVDCTSKYLFVEVTVSETTVSTTLSRGRYLSLLQASLFQHRNARKKETFRWSKSKMHSLFLLAYD